MTHRSSWKVAVLAAILIAALTPSESEAGRTTDLTVHHTHFGVSQFNYGNIAPDAAEPIRLMNPTGVSQVGAVFLYTRNNPFDPKSLPAEVFVGCVVELLTPHASFVVPGELLDVAGVCGDATNCPGYAEVIWAPSADRPGRRGKGMSDGLGGRTDAGAGQPAFELAHPTLFTPPEGADLAVARDCLAQSLDDLGLRSDLFEAFLPEAQLDKPERHKPERHKHERRRGRDHDHADRRH